MVTVKMFSIYCYQRKASSVLYQKIADPVFDYAESALIVFDLGPGNY